MDHDDKKFEEARRRFRRNMEQEAAKRRRTIFLDDDDLPSTSQGRGRTQPKEKCQSKRKTRNPMREEVRCNYMRTQARPRQPATPTKTPEEVIVLDSDSDLAPTPPRWVPEENGGEEPYTEEYPCELDAALIEELQRALFGMDDTTRVFRPNTPPSPIYSTSSLDWESENFRPPTPPRRRGVVSIEEKDRQFRQGLANESINPRKAVTFGDRGQGG